MTQHARALAELRHWSTPDAQQARLRADYVAFLEEHPDGLDRTCFPRHLTAGVVVLSHDLTEVLLNLHRKAELWLAFGGHVEPADTSLADAALREGREESGLASLDFDPEPVELSVHEVGFCHPGGPVDHLDVRYAARAPAGAELRASDESLDVRWWPLDGISSSQPGLPDDMVRLVERARARLESRQSASSPGGGSTLDAADQPSR